jgi:hypothetical protein
MTGKEFVLLIKESIETAHNKITPLSLKSKPLVLEIKKPKRIFSSVSINFY